MLEKVLSDRQAQQLFRLERLTDVVYAIVLWRLFALIPKPEEGWHWNTLGDFFVSEVMVFVLVIIGVVFTIIYWLQNNTLSSKLKKTDGKHTVFAIWQIFFLMLFLYSLKVGIALGASPATRAFESVAAALVGYAAGWGWAYAIKKRRLLHDDITDEEALALRDRTLAEPLAATFTLLFCFFPILWEFAWLSYPLIVKLLGRRRKARPAAL